ncbi:hypothetical protein ACJJTC_008734 [Scirpophaga incertulas]
MAGDGDIKELIKKRGSYKGRLTNFITYCTESGKKDLTTIDAKESQLRLGKLEALYEHYDEVQFQLECLVSDVESQYVLRSEFESQYYQALANAQVMLSKFNKNSEESDGSEKSTRPCPTNSLKLRETETALPPDTCDSALSRKV